MRDPVYVCEVKLNWLCVKTAKHFKRRGWKLRTFGVNDIPGATCVFMEAFQWTMTNQFFSDKPIREELFRISQSIQFWETSDSRK